MLRIVTLIATATLPDVLYIPLTIALLCMRVFELLYVLICVNCGIKCDMLNNGVFFPPPTNSANTQILPTPNDEYDNNM